MLNTKLGLNTNKNVRLVKGSHIVVPKLFEGDQAFILQNKDKRIVFAIPYQGDVHAVGTTDMPVESDARQEGRDQRRTKSRYLCDAINHFFKRAIDADRRGLDLFGRAPALRRRLASTPRR